MRKFIYTEIFLINQSLRVFLINQNLATVFGFVHCCYILALVLTCFRLTMGRATYFRPETIVTSFFHLMVLLSKVLLNHS